MKNTYAYKILLLTLLTMAGCRKLDRFPLDSPSTSTFYSNKTELDLAVSALYNSGIYPQDWEEWSDNFWNRTTIGNEIIHSTATIQSFNFSNTWLTCYKGIARANGILDNINKATDVTDAYRQQVEAQARFARAYEYSLLIVHFGDVPLIKTTLSLADSYKIKRTPVAEIKAFINSEFDFAASVLPVSYTSGLQYFTKGVVLGMKARMAISFNDWATAADAAKQIMDLKVYSLYPSYRNLFLRAGQHSSEVILSFPRSVTYLNTYDIQYTISRLTGGFASSTKDNKKVANKDNKGSANPFASFTGYLWKKGIDDSQLANINKVDLDQIVLRYAEILLIYAEAKIELNQIDQTVLDAINAVRARGYGVAPGATGSYPAVTTTAQSDLRRILRRERRTEFALEGRRYLDLLRWKLIDKVFSKPMYGIPINKADYPYPGTPVFDEDDIPSYEAFASKLTVIDRRVFDPKYYLWPVPYNELALNSELGQNPGW
jgi:hypothetical protein